MDYGTKGGAITFGFNYSDSDEIETEEKKVTTNVDSEEPLINVDEGICYLTKVSGEFDGGGEYAAVRQKGYQWVLEVGGVCHGWKDNNCDRKEVQAQARCYYYDQ